MSDLSSAIARGLSCYAVLYIFIIHLFVVWKWETMVLEEFVVFEYYNDPIPPERPSMVTFTRFLEETKIKVATNGPTHRSSGKVNKVLTDYHATLRNWDYWDSNKSSSSELLPVGTKKVKIVSSIKLLMMPSLEDINDCDHMNATFQVALREFQGLVDHKLDIQWNLIHELLADSKLPVKEKIGEKELYESLCKLPPLSLEDEALLEWDHQELLPEDPETQEEEEDLDMSIYLTEDDMNMHYQMLEAVLQKRNGSIKEYLNMKSNVTISLALKEAIDILRHDLSDAQAFAEESVEATMQKLQQSAAKADHQNMVNPSTCDLESVGDAVTTLLEAGMLAMQQHHDLQEVIQRELKAMGFGKGITLEKINIHANSPIPERVPRATVNFRRVIDTPLLRHSSQTIDALLEFTRLYTDAVTKLVEDLNLPKIPKASTGKRLTTYILQKAGMQTISFPKQIHNLLLQSERGQAFLSTHS